jgi:8-oxo-dGTP diphosphatase
MIKGVDYIGVTATALVHDGKGRILLQKRGPEARDERGRWDFCGGSIEFGDTIEQTIRKELMEELSLTQLSMEFLTVYDALRTNDAGAATHWVAIMYAVKVDPSQVKIGEPHKIAEIGWFRAKDLPSPRHSQFDKSYLIALSKGLIT